MIAPCQAGAIGQGVSLLKQAHHVLHFVPQKARGLGATASILNIGLMFGVLSRLIWYLIPHALIDIPGDQAGKPIARSSI